MAWNLVTLRWSRRHTVTVLAAAAVIGLVLLSVQQPRFGKEKFELLYEGMTEAEVVEVLGCPAGDYRPAIWIHPNWFVSPSDAIGFPLAERGRPLEELKELERKDVEKWIEQGQPIPPSPTSVQWKWWWAREFGINVAFDSRGRVCHCSLLRLIPPRHPHDVIRWVRW